ncbi:MAG TPA: lysylphosphatidylglycerol synthase transmembrane domain-containing protein [Solirubrobacteraceae bacterium]
MAHRSHPAADALSPAEMSLPAFEARALARRAAVPAAFAALAAAALILAGGPLQAFADALRRALDADPRWVAVAAVSELASFGGYIALLWLVGGRATPRLGLRESTQVTLGGAAATRLLPTAGVGGAALTLWALRRTGMGSRRATRTLMTFLIVLYSVFLVAIVAAGTALALGLARRHGPLALSVVPAVGAALVIVIALSLGAVAPRDGRASGRMGRAAALAGEAVRDGLRLVRAADPRLLGAAAWWACDAAVLWAMLHAFGAPPSLALLALAYFVGQVGNTVPVPGAVSGGMVGILVASGVAADLALVSVLAYRCVAIWLPAPAGLAALSGLRRTVARWGRDEAGLSDAAVAPPVGSLPSAVPTRPAPAACTRPAVPTRPAPAPCARPAGPARPGPASCARPPVPIPA